MTLQRIQYCHPELDSGSKKKTPPPGGVMYKKSYAVVLVKE
jgi:hypothetical protein